MSLDDELKDSHMHAQVDRKILLADQKRQLLSINYHADRVTGIVGILGGTTVGALGVYQTMQDKPSTLLYALGFVSIATGVYVLTYAAKKRREELRNFLKLIKED